eukprot:365349-Chlamydomonas_euryale.AAC.6
MVWELAADGTGRATREPNHHPRTGHPPAGMPLLFPAIPWCRSWQQTARRCFWAARAYRTLTPWCTARGTATHSRSCWRLAAANMIHVPAKAKIQTAQADAAAAAAPTATALAVVAATFRASALSRRRCCCRMCRRCRARGGAAARRPAVPAPVPTGAGATPFVPGPPVEGARLRRASGRLSRRGLHFPHFHTLHNRFQTLAGPRPGICPCMPSILRLASDLS